MHRNEKSQSCQSWYFLKALSQANPQPIAKCKVKENQIYWRADAKAYPPTSHRIASHRIGISAGEKCFCHLPVLTCLNRQKVAEIGKNEDSPLTHYNCFLKPVNTSIRNT